MFISRVVVHVRPVSPASPASCPPLGPRIDLERVQTIMESMGSKLSPGAQQLMSLVRFQQQQVSRNGFLSRHSLLCVCVCVCVDFFGMHPWPMEVPRLGIKLELWLPASATAAPDP